MKVKGIFLPTQVQSVLPSQPSGAAPLLYNTVPLLVVLSPAQPHLLYFFSLSSELSKENAHFLCSEQRPLLLFPIVPQYNTTNQKRLPWKPPWDPPIGSGCAQTHMKSSPLQTLPLDCFYNLFYYLFYLLAWWVFCRTPSTYDPSVRADKINTGTRIKCAHDTVTYTGHFVWARHTLQTRLGLHWVSGSNNNNKLWSFKTAIIGPHFQLSLS